MPNKKLVGIIVGIAIILYLFTGLLLRWGQTKLIFKPDSLIKSTPQKYGLNYQDVWIEVNPGKIHGWWIPHKDESAPVMVYFHGNGSNNGDVVNLAAIFNELGLSVLLVDYRGYGKSSPVFPNETRVYEDAEAAWDYLTQKRQITPENIFVYGHSLGGAIAIELASRHPEIAGLITEGTFTSILEMAKLGKVLQIFPLDWIVTQRFDSASKVKSLQTPILILHGSDDRTIPVEMAAELMAIATEPKQLAIIPQAGHDNLEEVGGEEYKQYLQRFIRANSATADTSL